jgi:DNA-directed RNA polymerase subunit RPC12/RpoP
MSARSRRDGGRPPVRTYDVWCPACAAEWLALSADDVSLKTGEVVALARCEGCRTVSSVVVRQTGAELVKLRREMLKTVQKMCQSFVQAQTRLDERRRTLARELHQGNTDLVDELRDVEARLSALKPPDTSHLEARAREIASAMGGAPSTEAMNPCPGCGAGATVCRETRNGFQIACPRCSHKLMVRLKVAP